MKLLVAADAHIYRTKDGKYWTPKIYGYDFWTRYLNVFDKVRVVARLKQVDNFSEKWSRVDGPNVEIYGVPFFQGPKQLAKVYFQIHKRLCHAGDGCSVALIRMPSNTAYMCYQHVKGKMPIAGEIVYDPTDDLKDPSASFKLRTFNKIISKRLADFCMNANGVSYVTEHTIQQHYPCRAKKAGESKKYFESYFSTITLNENAFTAPRNFSEKKSLILVLSDVAMDTERKGERTLINAVRIANEKGCDIHAVIIGDGAKRKEFEKLARQCGVRDKVKFTGLLSTSDDVRKVLLDSDIFVFPSKGEGLPRGVLEAMAVGMPVLASPAGGIPEVIGEKYLFDSADADGFANAIVRLANHPDELNEMSRDNFAKAQKFRNDVLQIRRDEFYQKLRNLAETPEPQKSSGGGITQKHSTHINVALEPVLTMNFIGGLAA